MKLRKITLVALMILGMSTFVIGCSDEDENNNTTTTTESEVTTQEQTTTKEVEITTEEPTTTKEVETTTSYQLKGKEFSIANNQAKFFYDFVLNTGDKIYLNEVWPGDTEVDRMERGSAATTIYTNFGMDSELDEFEKKYMESEGLYVPEVPEGEKYYIEYSGPSVKFVFYKSDKLRTYFDMVPIE